MSDFAAGSNALRVVRTSEALDVSCGNEVFSADPARGQLSFRDQLVHGSNADAQRYSRIFARVENLLNLVIHNPSSSNRNRTGLASGFRSFIRNVPVGIVRFLNSVNSGPVRYLPGARFEG
jgi:hypothetical protein